MDGVYVKFRSFLEPRRANNRNSLFPPIPDRRIRQTLQPQSSNATIQNYDFSSFTSWGSESTPPELPPRQRALPPPPPSPPTIIANEDVVDSPHSSSASEPSEQLEQPPESTHSEPSGSTIKKTTKRKITVGYVFQSVQRGIQHLFGWYGYFLGKFPYVTLIMGLIIGFGCASGLFKIKLKDISESDFADPKSLMADDYKLFRYTFPNATCGPAPSRFRSLLRKTTTVRPSTTTLRSEETNLTRSKRQIPDILSRFNISVPIPQNLTNVTASNIYACFSPENQVFKCSCREFFIVYDFIGCSSGRANAGILSRCSDINKHGFISSYPWQRLLETEKAILDLQILGPTRPDFTIAKLCRRKDSKNASEPCSDFHIRSIASEVRYAVIANSVPFPYLDNTRVLSHTLGNVKIARKDDGKWYAVKAEALQSSYGLCVASTPRNLDLLKRFDKFFDSEMARLNRDVFEPNGIKVSYYFWDRTIDYSMRQLYNLIPKFLATIVAVAFWASVAMTGSDIVTSKPWLGLIGILSTLLANAAGIGLMAWFNYQFSVACAGVPFLILAIGLDDMFVVITGLRQTSVYEPRKTRMKKTMFASGTAIFITALTNIVAEAIGSKAPIKIISEFTLYTLVLMSFDFLLQVTIFASSLALFAMGEPKGRNMCCCCVRAPKRNPALFREKSLSYIICCAANAKSMRNYEAINALHSKTRAVQDDEETDYELELERMKDPEDLNPEIAAESALKRLAHNYSRFLMKTSSRYVTLLIYVGYLAFCIYGVLTLHYGMRNEHGVPFSSPEYRFMKVSTEKYANFRQISVFLGNESILVEYWRREVQEDLERMIRKLETSGFFHPSSNMTRFWLRDYLEYLKLNETMEELALSSREHFWDFLYDNFAKDTKKQWLLDDDLRIDPAKSYACRTRAHLVAVDMVGERQVAAFRLAQTIRKEYAKYGVVVYDPAYSLYEQKTNTVYTSVYYILITVASAIAVSAFMVPHLVLIFYIAAMILSEVLGLIGFMPYVGMDLDMISLTMLIVNIGYSVDFVMHLAYDYQKAEGSTRVKKVIGALTDVSHALIPAASGTIMSVMAMATTDLYIYSVYFLSMALAVAISSLHAVVFMPVFLSFFGSIDRKMIREHEAEKDEQQQGKVEAPDNSYYYAKSVDSEEAEKKENNKAFKIFSHNFSLGPPNTTKHVGKAKQHKIEISGPTLPPPPIPSVIVTAPTPMDEINPTSALYDDSVFGTNTICSPRNNANRLNLMSRPRSSLPNGNDVNSFKFGPYALEKNLHDELNDLAAEIAGLKRPKRSSKH